MAKSGVIKGTQSGTRPYLEIRWSAQSPDIANNRTRVTLDMYLVSPYSINFKAAKTGTLHGKSFTYSSGFVGKGERKVYSYSLWVAHDSNGKKTFSVSGNFNININWSGSNLSTLNVSGNITLDDIPRSSTLNSFSIINSLRVGTANSVSLSITRASSSFTHDIQLKLGSTVIASWNGQGTPTSLSLTASQVNNLLNRIPTTSSRVTLVVQTKSGSAKIGSALSRNATATVSSTVIPTVSGLTVSIAGNGHDKAISTYVRHFTKVSFSFNESATGGATVKSRNIVIRRRSDKGNSQQINARTGTTPNPVQLVGEYEAIATVVDSRGRSNSQTVYFDVVYYSPPKITEFRAERNSSTPTTVNISVKGGHSHLSSTANRRNNLSIIVQWKPISSSTWNSVSSTTSTTATFSISPSSTGKSVGSSFDFRVIITDDFGKSATSMITVSTEKAVLDIYRDRGIGVGKYYERGVIDAGGDIYADGQVDANGYTVSDTRDIVDNPEDIEARAVSYAFKRATTVGSPPISATGTYAHILRMAGWNTSEGSGGFPTELSFGDGLAVRQATSATAWGPWRELAVKGDISKADVGLGSVQNYAVATQAQAEAGTVNNRYMTPLRVLEAIEANPEIKYGGNVNTGWWFELPGNTLICMGYIEIDASKWTFQNANFPKSFASNDYSMTWNRIGGTVDTRAEMAALGSIVPSGDASRCRFGVGQPTSSSKIFTLFYTAIGRG